LQVRLEFGISVAPTGYKELLATFKRDCDELDIIAKLMRNLFRPSLKEPLLDVGAGSGELAARAFPDLRSFLIDKDKKQIKQPRSPNHRRIYGDFLHTNLTSMNLRTILFCHSAQYFAKRQNQLARKLVESRANFALVVSNERSGILAEIFELLASDGIAFPFLPFHEGLPLAKLVKKVPFSASVQCSDTKMMAELIAYIVLDLPRASRAASVILTYLEARRSSTSKIEIDEAIYWYRLQRS
jgi:hypothetical protein